MPEQSLTDAMSELAEMKAASAKKTRFETLLDNPWFMQSLNFTLGVEGGYKAPDPADPNPTMKGVTQAVYDAWRTAMGQAHQPVIKITDDEVRRIYAGYATQSGADLVANAGYPITGSNVLDCAINEGAVTSAKMFQQVLGVEADGIVGDKTIAALSAFADAPLALMCHIRRERNYASIIEKRPETATFFFGWILRGLKFVNHFQLVPGV